MSKRFFCGFILTILFVSINLLSMYDHKLGNSLSNSKNADKKEKKHKDLLFNTPSSVPHFQQQSITLHNNNTNQHSLIFNRNELPRITHYLLDSKPVATLMQINDEINFESNDSKPHNFSVQIPYQTGSLTVSTQGRFVFEKKIDTYSAYIASKTIDFCDTFFSNSGLIVEADNCRSNAQLACCDFLFKGKKFVIIPKSSLNVHNSLTLTAQSLILNDGVIDCKNESLLNSSLFKNSGIFTSHNMHFDGKDMINASVMKIFGLLSVDSKNIKLEKTSCITVDNANLTVNQGINNEGTLSVNQHLSAHAHYISNAGKIETNSSTIKADRYFYNKILSTLSAKNNLTIHTPLSLNIFGLTHAQYLTINSAIGLNALGIYAAKSMNTNALASINAGLLLPKFDAFSEMYSQAHLWGIGESLFINYVPFYGVIYAALKSAQGTYQQGKTFYNEVGSLRKQKSIGTSSVIALLYSIKNMLSSVRQTFNLGKQSYHLLSDSPQSNDSQVLETSPDSTTKAKDVAQHVASTIASHYAPCVNTSSIVDLNYGAAIGINNHSTSLYNRNLNTSLYVNHIIDTRYGKNIGYLDAYNLNINATDSYDSDGNIMISNGNIQAYCLKTKGRINALKNITLQGKDSANIDGDIIANKIAVKSDHNITINSHLTSEDTYLHSKYIDQKGNISAQQVVMDGDGISNDGTIKAPKIIITQANLPERRWFIFRDSSPSFFHNKGNLQASDQLFVDTKNINLSIESQISTPNAYFKSDGEWYNAGKMNTEQLTLDVKSNVTNSGSLQSHKIIINQEKLDNNSWAASGRIFHNQGNIQASEQLSVDTQNIHLGEKSYISAPHAHFKSNGEWQNDGKIDVGQMILDAKKDMTSSGPMKANKLTIVHSGPDYNGWLKGWRKNHYVFLNQTNLQISERLFVDAKDIHLTDKSQVTTPNAYFKSHGNWQNSGNIQTFDQLFVDAKNIQLHEKSHVDAPNAYFKSDGNWQNNGKLKTEKCIVDSKRNAINTNEINAAQLLYVKAQNISLDQKSNIKSKDAYYTANHNVSIDGVMDVERGSVEAGGKVRTIGKIGASNQLGIHAKDIAIEKTSHVSAPTTCLEAIDTIDTRGKLSTSDLFAHAKYIKNSGEITSDNKAHIKADRYFWNMLGGSIDVENDLTIDALLSLNTLGYISANSLCTNSIIDVNLLGIYRGNNVCQNSFISYNKGILIPKFKSLDDLKKSLEENKGRFAESFALQFVPRLSGTYSLLKSAIMCLSKNKEEKEASLWGRAIALQQHIDDLYKKKDLCVSDIVPALCQTKNILTSAMQTGCQISEVGQQAYQTTQDYLNSKPKQFKVGQQIYVGGQQAYQTAQDYLNGKSNTTKNSPQKQKASNNNTMSMLPIAMSFVGSQISTAVSIAGPQLSRSSLFDVNNGLILGVNGNSQSLYTMNTGVSFFANNNSVSTISGTNAGFIGGGNVCVNAADSYSSNGIMGAVNISLMANNAEVSGNTYAFNNVLLKAHNNAVLDRKIKAKNVTIHAKNVHIKKDASIVSQDKADVIAMETIINKGTIDGKQTTVQGREVILDNDSKIFARGGDGVAVIKATQVLGMHEESKIHSEGKTNIHSDGYAKIDGSVTGNKTSVQANALDIQENAHISSESQTNVIATETIINKGTIDGKHTTIQGSEVILENSSNVLTHGDDGHAVVKAKNLSLKDGSRINTNATLIDAQSIQGEKGNTIASTNGTVVTTNQINNKGIINGTVALNFNGNADQLESIGAVDQIIYNGTLENNIADKLANGHNELLNVSKGGAIVISAQQQDVHLKKQHTNMTHTLQVQTKGYIKCDQDLSSEKSIWLQAQGNLHHESVKSKEITGLIGKNIYSAGHIIREKHGENYTETCEKNNVSGNQVIIQAQQDVDYKAMHIQSGTGGTQLYFGNKFISDSLTVETYNKTEEFEMEGFRKKTVKSVTTTEDTMTTSVPNVFSSEGTTRITGNIAELHDTIFDSKGGTVIQAKTEYVPTYDTHKQVKEIKKAGKTINHTESISQKLKPLTINDSTPAHIISDQPVSLYLQCSTPSITIDAPTVELLTAQQTTQTRCYEDKTYVRLWNRGTVAESYDVVPDQSYSGIINTNAETIHIEDIKNNAPAIIHATSKNPLITRSLIDDVHTYQKKSLYNRPTKLLISVVALSISMAMQALAPVVGTCITAKIGIEAGVTSALTTQAALGGMNALCFEAANTLLHCNGDFRGAAKKFASTKTVRTIAITALTAATTAGANKFLDKVLPPLPQATTLNKRFLSTAPRELINGGIRFGGDVAQGKDPKKATKHRLKSAAANTIGAVASSGIGKAYGDKKIGPVTHKILHAGVGGIEGAIFDGKNGAIAGAIGAGVAETIADITSPKPPSIENIKKLESKYGRALTQDEFAHEWNKQLSQYFKRTHSVADASKMIAATVANLAQQDMNIAFETATKAVDHNFIIFATYAATGASIAYSGYLISEAYTKEGFEGACKQLGIEVIQNAVGLVGARVTQKVLFKVGGILYPSAKEAVNAALNMSPGLKTMLGNVTESLITAGEKLSATKVGKQVARASQCVQQVETKLINAENKLFDKVVKNLSSSPENLVEHVVPANVLHKVEDQLAQQATKKYTNKLAQTGGANVSLATKETSSILSQDVTLSMKEIAEQELAKANRQLDVLNKQVEELSKIVSHDHVGELLNMDIDYTKIEKLEAETKKFYDLIRSTNDDINAIVKNTGISKEMLNQIKNHVFFEEHILRDGIMRFDPCVDMAAAWKRLMNGNFVYSDLVLLQHEYAESFAMQGIKIPYCQAHDVVNKVYNWEKSYK